MVWERPTNKLVYISSLIEEVLKGHFLKKYLNGLVCTFVINIPSVKL